MKKGIYLTIHAIIYCLKQKFSGYKAGIKFYEYSVAVEQNNYKTEIVNASIVCDLDTCPRNCLFDTTNIVKNSDKEKWVNSGYGIVFHDFTWNIVIFVVGNSSSSHADNYKNTFFIVRWKANFLVSIKALFLQKKSLVLILVKQTQNFIWLCIVMVIAVKNNKDNKTINFPTQFCLQSISNAFRANESREICLQGNVCDFSVDWNAIGKFDILNIHEYLMVKII